MTTPAAVAGVLGASAVLFAGTAVIGTRRDAILVRMGVRPGTRAARGSMASAPSWVWSVAGSLAASLVGLRVAGGPGAIAAAGCVLTVPVIVRRRGRAAASRRTQDQLAEGISVLAAALRAGRSLRQAIELAGAEVDAPIGPSFERITARVELGDPMDDAIATWAEEISGADARLAAGVLRMHRRTGGALAVTLDRLAETLRNRGSAARELRSLTAQARLSANILGLLPLGFFTFLSVIAREDMVDAITAPSGATAIALGLVLQAAAYVWIRGLLRIEP